MRLQSYKLDKTLMCLGRARSGPFPVSSFSGQSHCTLVASIRIPRAGGHLGDTDTISDVGTWEVKQFMVPRQCHHFGAETENYIGI